jgi:MHS family alpha-ketoglutarate permease-like MFS transporter
MSGSEPAGTTASVRTSRRAIFAATLGNFVEWYDWFIYALLTPVFAAQIFQSGSQLGSVIQSLAVFAVGFFVRPIAGVVLSPLGDRFGRRAMLTATIALMAFGSLIMAIVPPAHSVGVLAPVLVLIARVLQGISTGAEAQNAYTYLVEHGPPERKGLSGSLMTMTSGLGTLAATGTTSLVLLAPDPALHDWVWRIPFAIGAVIGLIGLVVRVQASESPEFAEVAEEGRIDKTPIRTVLRKYPWQCVQVAALQAASMVFYIWSTYLAQYSNLTSGRPLSEGTTGSVIGLCVYVVIIPLSGYISDRWLSRRTLALISGWGLVLLIYPLLLLTTVTGFEYFLIASIVGWILVALVSGVYPALFVELFPPEVRISGIGLPYQLCTAAIVGTAPLIGALFQNAGKPDGLAFYSMIIMFLASLVYVTLPRRTATAPSGTGAQEPRAAVD